MSDAVKVHPSLIAMISTFKLDTEQYDEFTYEEWNEMLSVIEGPLIDFDLTKVENAAKLLAMQTNDMLGKNLEFYFDQKFSYSKEWTIAYIQAYVAIAYHSSVRELFTYILSKKERESVLYPHKWNLIFDTIEEPALEYDITDIKNAITMLFKTEPGSKVQLLLNDYFITLFGSSEWNNAIQEEVRRRTKGADSMKKADKPNRLLFKKALFESLNEIAVEFPDFSEESRKIELFIGQL
jgi:hypothetical protein